MRRSRTLLITAVFALLPFASPTAPSASRPAPAMDSAYVSALATANRLLQAWQSGDVENGLPLLNTQVRQTATSDGVSRFFSNSGPLGYEINRGRILKRGRYEFPVVLIGFDSKHRVSRHLSSIVVVHTGNNDWAVDKLP